MEPEIDDLDARLKRYYERQTISPALVDRLTTRIGSGGLPRPLHRLPAWLAVAAVLAVVIGGVLYMTRTDSGSDAHNRISELAARDVALHHRKQFSLDYRSETMEQLSQQMTKLDFNPIMPVRMEPGTRLVGARYCAVLGQIAAQFRFVDEAGRPYTLYQTRCQGEFADLPEGEFEIDGTHVQLWREAGLLMVLAFSG